MQADYQPFIERVIHKYEGGYGWNRKDPGGPTKYGITCYDLAQHRGQKMTSMAAWEAPVRDMTLQEAEAIYRTKYAIAVAFDQQAAGVDCCVLDYAINSGTARAQRVAAAIGPLPPKEFIDAMCAERLRFMHVIRGGSAWAEFGRGWQARVDDLRAYSEHLVAGGTHETAPPAPDLTHVAQPKAQHVPNTAPGKTAGGVVVAGGAAHAAGVPWWGVAAVCGGVLVAGVAYELWQERHANAANALVHA